MGDVGRHGEADALAVTDHEGVAVDDPDDFDVTAGGDVGSPPLSGWRGRAVVAAGEGCETGDQNPGADCSAR